MLGEITPIKVKKEMRPQLIVVVDTEEEFNWSADPDRNETGVSAMKYITRAQEICDQYGLAPCYVIDYPVATKPEGYEPLKQIFSEGRCEIGAHLHPWVNPPFDETLSRENMYPGNLARDIEYNKLLNLSNAIEASFGKKPNTYKAGRYGLGKNTVSILKELGFEIDLSVCPPVDYRADGGPDYSDASAEPVWFGPEQNMLEIPITGGFVGWGGAASKQLFNWAQLLKRFKVPGILSRLNIVDRLMLSPEGFNVEEHIKVTKFLYNQGVRTFTWSFHSPSVVPGMTPYVHNESDLERFLDSFRRYFDFFFNQLSGEASTPTRLKAQLEALK